MLGNRLFSPVPRILILLLFLTVNSAQNSNPPSSCSSSSCGNARISFPYRLRTQPRWCGYNDPNFELDCRNNQTVVTVRSRTYLVQDIDYDYYTIRLVDPSINPANLSSCPVLPSGYEDWPSIYSRFFDLNVPVAFVHCLNPVNSSRYVGAPFCGNRSGAFSNSSETHSYVVAGERMQVSDLEDSCTVDRVAWSSGRTLRPEGRNSSLAGVYDGLAYGLELSWFRVLCGECERTLGTCSSEGNQITCRHYCREDTPISQLSFSCQVEYYGLFVGFYGSFVIAGLLALRFVLGFPLLVALVVYTWRRRHLPVEGSVAGIEGKASDPAPQLPAATVV